MKYSNFVTFHRIVDTKLKLFCAFVFTSQILQFLYFLNSIFCTCKAQFVSDLFGNNIIGFLMTRLRFNFERFS